MLATYLEVLRQKWQITFTWSWFALSRWLGDGGCLGNSVADFWWLRPDLVWSNSWDVLERVCVSRGWVKFNSLFFSQSIGLGHDGCNCHDALVGFCPRGHWVLAYSWNLPPSGGLWLVWVNPWYCLPHLSPRLRGANTWDPPESVCLYFGWLWQNIWYLVDSRTRSRCGRDGDRPDDCCRKKNTDYILAFI